MSARTMVRVTSWALYDLANQFFGLNIIALYFVRWVTVEHAVPEPVYAAVYALSTLVVALLMPWLGALADARRSYRFFLTVCTLVSVAGTLVLGILRFPGPALFWFALANIGCQAGIIFYNALLPSVAAPGRIGLISGVGRLAGYLGAVICLLLSRPVFAQGGYAAVFQMTGWLFLLFSMPCLLFVPDPEGKEAASTWRAALKQCSFKGEMKRLANRAAQLREYPAMSAFLKAIFFGLMAVQTLMLFMSVYVTRVFDLPAGRVNILLALGTLCAMAGSLAAGMIGDRIGQRRVVATVLRLWILWLLLAAGGGSSAQWVIAGVGGMTLGATWVSARALALGLMPPERAAEMFGIYNLTAVAAGIAGPLYWSVGRIILSPWGMPGYRLTMAILILPVAAGLWLLQQVPEPAVAKIKKRPDTYPAA